MSFAAARVYGTYFHRFAQGRMEQTLWEEPQRYIANSPVMHLDRVDAPLLIITGGKDTMGPQSDEMYLGLAALGKDVTLLRYPEAGHSAVWPWNREECSRMLDWLDRRLN